MVAWTAELRWKEIILGSAPKNTDLLLRVLKKYPSPDTIPLSQDFHIFLRLDYLSFYLERADRITN